MRSSPGSASFCGPDPALRRSRVEAPSRSVTRDRVLDLMRGFAILLMISSHVGPRSLWTTALHLPYWFSAATPFILLSGVVLGRLQRAKPKAAPILHRGLKLWTLHILLMIVVIAVHESTGRLRTPSIEALGGFWDATWKTLLLRNQPFDYMNILPMYIVFFLLVPPAMAAIRRGWTWALLGLSASVWCWAMFNPELPRFADPACGPQSFVLTAWQFPFVIGLSAGAHWDRLAYRTWPNLKAWALPAVFTFVGSVFIVAQLNRNFAVSWNVSLPVDPDWVAKAPWAPLRGGYIVGVILLTYLGLEWLRQHRPEWFERLGHVELIGKKSLYCFIVHLPLALLCSAFELWEYPRWLEDLITPVAIVVVYLLARHGVGESYVTLTFAASERGRRARQRSRAATERLSPG